MKITDNMLRVINHVYKNNKSMDCLIKTGITDISTDENFLVKSYQTLTLLSNIIDTMQTTSERDFFSFTIGTIQFNTRINREKSIDSSAITIKEYISANGVVYSDFLDYIYANLTKYNPIKNSDSNKTLLKTSMERLYSSLYRVADLRDQQLKSYDMPDVLKDFEGLQEKSRKLNESLKSLKLTIDNIKSSVKTISSVLDNLNKETLSEIHNGSVEVVDIDTITSIVREEIAKEIRIMKTKLLRDHIIKIVDELKNKLNESIDKDEESKMYNDISNTLDKILSNLSVRENNTLGNLNLVVKLDEITNSIENIFTSIANDNKLLENSEDRLYKAVDDFDKYLV